MHAHMNISQKKGLIFFSINKKWVIIKFDCIKENKVIKKIRYGLVAINRCWLTLNARVIGISWYLGFKASYSTTIKFITQAWSTKTQIANSNDSTS